METELVAQNNSTRLGRFLRWLVPNGGTLLVAFLLIFTQTVWARSPQRPEAASTSTIAYQGQLVDSGGAPLTGLYDMEFRLYNIPSGGTALWTEAWTGANAVQVSDGLFNVMLGSLNNTLAAAIAGYDELYLGIKVGADSEMTPRVQVGSVPFAMQALTVPDDSITSSKLNLQSGSVCLDANASVTFPGGGNYDRVPIPGLTLTLDLDHPASILVWTLGKYTIDPAIQGAHSGTSVFLDGNEQFYDLRMPGGGIETFVTLKQIPVDPGSHIVDLRSFYLYVGSGSALYLSGTCLQYLVID